MGKNRNKQQHVRHSSKSSTGSSPSNDNTAHNNNNNSHTTNRRHSNSTSHKQSRNQSQRHNRRNQHRYGPDDFHSDDDDDFLFGIAGAETDETFFKWVSQHKIDLAICILCGFLLGTGFGIGFFPGNKGRGDGADHLLRTDTDGGAGGGGSFGNTPSPLNLHHHHRRHKPRRGGQHYHHNGHSSSAPWQIIIRRRIRSSTPFHIVRSVYRTIFSAFSLIFGGGGSRHRSSHSIPHQQRPKRFDHYYTDTDHNSVDPNTAYNNVYDYEDDYEYEYSHQNGHYSNPLLAPYDYIEVNGRMVRDDPSHPLTFAILREAVMRVDGGSVGYVHPDLGYLVPAPSGAARGLGMVRDSYNACQIRCHPGTVAEQRKIKQDKIDAEHERMRRRAEVYASANADDDGDGDDNNKGGDDSPKTTTIEEYEAELEKERTEKLRRRQMFLEAVSTREGLSRTIDEQLSSEQLYHPEEILLRIPLGIQMTRTLALHTLFRLVPPDVQLRLPLTELDDAFLLTLLLTHEKGLGLESVFAPYIASLPLNPPCSYSPSLRRTVLETISIMGVEGNMDVNGWPGEINKAAEHAGMIGDSLAKDYGPYLAPTRGETIFQTLQWSLCQVASRATAGSERHGKLRLVPIMDLINHDVDAGGFEEVDENGGVDGWFEKGEVAEITEDDSGAFVVRSMRHGRNKPLKVGQELLVDYNVPEYSPFDWFVSGGFVPPERRGKWTLIEGVLPKVRHHSTTARNKYVL